MSTRQISTLWYAGTALTVGVLSVAPFLIWSCAVHHGIIQPCWRIPMAAPFVFDLWAYLEFMGSEISGAAYGGLLQWFGPAIRWIAGAFPGASVPEIWLGLRWLFGTVSLWMFAWTAERMLRVTATTARWWAVMLWVSVFLLLGFRPGAYSWYLPFGLASVVCSWLVSDSLRHRRWLKSVGLSLAALAASSVYVWFAIVILLWLSVVWSIALIRVARRAWIGLMVLAAGSVPFIVFAALSIISEERFRIFWETNIRLGLGFTRLPMLTSMALAAMLWTILMTWHALRLRDHPWAGRLARLTVLWFVILGCWFMSPFTGIYLHTDHFRLITLIAAALSACALWCAFRERHAYIEKRMRVWLWVSGGIAGCFAARIILQPYAWSGDQLQTIHLAVWLSVLLSILIALRPSRSVSRAFFAWAIVGCAAIGVLPYIATFVRNDALMKDACRYQTSVTWIRQHTIPESVICTDPDTANVIAAHAGRRVIVNQQTFFSRETDTALYERLRIVASRYDLDTSGATEAWADFATANEGTICGQFAYLDHLPLVRNLPASVRAVLKGCSEEKLNDNDARIRRMAVDETVPEGAFVNTCPVVVVTRGNKWNLPHSYSEAYTDDVVRIFTVDLDARSF